MVNPLCSYLVLTGVVLTNFGSFIVSMWQIEEIWRSLQNGWAYNLPFGLATNDYWFAHDFWFCVQYVNVFVILAVVFGVLVKLTLLQSHIDHMETTYHE